MLLGATSKVFIYDLWPVIRLLTPRDTETLREQSDDNHESSEAVGAARKYPHSQTT